MRPGIYDDNKNRSYPLIRLPDVPAVDQSVLIDCQFDFAAYAGFVPGVSVVWLSRISSDSTNVTLRFSTDAEELSSISLDFVIPRSGPEFQHAFASADATFPDSTPCAAQLAWFGFVIVCNRQAIVDATGGGPVTFTKTQTPVEPVLVRTMEDSYVRSVSVANQRRTLVTDTADTVRPYLVYDTCLQGPIKIAEGHNCRITVDPEGNALKFGGAIGAGLGQVCEEIPASPDETAPSGSDLLSGGPSCNEVVKRINGLTGPTIGLRGTQGFDVKRHPSITSRLLVTLDPDVLPRPT